jgi:hypothetical protein
VRLTLRQMLVVVKYMAQVSLLSESVVFPQCHQSQGNRPPIAPPTIL